MLTLGISWILVVFRLLEKQKSKNKTKKSPYLKSHFKFEITDMVPADRSFQMLTTQNEILGC